nr:unnamed protein product [Callosobruchus chinensis]
MLSDGIPYHFDYFTLDLNNELSGVYGPLLYDQLEYANSSLYRILELYKQNRNKPKSVVVIGHSMWWLLTGWSNIRHTLISAVITLASPLTRPPFFLDYHTKKFYDGGFDNVPDTTSLISLTGGYSDFLIPPFLNKSEEQRIFTTTIPRAWVETNHVQILWCKQVVLAINRAFFDIVSVRKKQITNNTLYRDMVFHHHLVDWYQYKVLEKLPGSDSNQPQR